MSFRTTRAIRLNLAPGNHDGRYLTANHAQREKSHFFSDHVQIGNVSTRKVPGTAASSMMADALPAADKKGSSCDFMSNP
jgi:hypothetical protein